MAAVLAGALLALAGATAACSTSKPPGADFGGGGTDTGPPGSGASDDASDDAGAEDAGAPDAPPDAGDAACLGDDLEPDDAGTKAIDCPETGPCSEACARVVSHYRPGVAQYAARCAAALPSCESPFDMIPCVDQAVARACSEPTSSAYCKALVSACDPDAGGPMSGISEQGCVMLANGLGAAGRATFKACLDDKIASGTCAQEVVACADEIRR
ncbi:MAG: hypothetical protein KIS78_19305 [Labilithrix sp.]|nr:hypothetical protein [Labilithrix sp.]MCW5834558.1 hypothetical protein [Labilithrix sp.]